MLANFSNLISAYEAKSTNKSGLVTLNIYIIDVSILVSQNTIINAFSLSSFILFVLEITFMRVFVLKKISNINNFISTLLQVINHIIDSMLILR